MTKRALITGITGQDGSYLAEYLLANDYEVHGLIRRASTFNTTRIDHLYEDPHTEGARLFLHYGDVSDCSIFRHLIEDIEPDEIYNLAAQSHVRVSFELPIYTGKVTGLSVIGLLEAIRNTNQDIKFYQASSSEIFGASPPPQNEESTFHPRSPYAVAKVYGYWATVNYREAYGMHTSNGILFNHESPRRGETFVTRKITRAVARIVAKTQEKLYLGNLDSKRDWGYAPEFVVCMKKIVGQKESGDYVVGTGESHSVRDFLEYSFSYVGLNWEDYVEIDEKYLRPSEVDYLEADPKKAEKILGWKPMIKAPELAKIMVDYDMSTLSLTPPAEGESILERNGLNWLEEPIHYSRL